MNIAVDYQRKEVRTLYFAVLCSFGDLDADIIAYDNKADTCLCLVLLEDFKVLPVGILNEIKESFFEAFEDLLRDIFFDIVQESRDHLVDRQQVNSSLLQLLHLSHDPYKVL